MSKWNALYWQRIAVRGVADAVMEDSDGLVYDFSSDERGVDFSVEGDSAYRIEVRVFELKDDK